MSLLEPTAIALNATSLATTAVFASVSPFAWRAARDWNISSGSEQQLTLERRTYLISTLLVFVFTLQLMGLLLFVFNAERTSALFAGAMCAVGTLNVNAFGWPTLILKVVVFFASSTWLILNYADNRGFDYPLTRMKYRVLLVIVPLAATEAFLQSWYFLGLKADVITSCCASLFGVGKHTLASEVSSLSPVFSMSIFFATMAITIASGGVFYLRYRGAYLFATMSVLAFAVSITAIISFVSLYVYEHPHHHCPFCILKSEYDYQGYLLYLPLFAATAMSLGVAVLHPFRNIPSLKTVVPPLCSRLGVTATGLFLFFTLLVSHIVASSNLGLVTG